MQSPQAKISSTLVLPNSSTQIPLLQVIPDSSAISTLGTMPAPIITVSAFISVPSEHRTRSGLSSPLISSRLALNLKLTPLFS